MDPLILFQIIPLLGLAVYVVYMIYYIAIPVFRLRFLMFLACRKYHCTDIRVSDIGVVVKIMKDGQERTIWGRMDPDQDISYYPMTAASELKKVLKDIRRGNI